MFFNKYIETENTVLVPVPMHFLRRWKRGYNQSEKIAQNLSKVCGISVDTTLIKRSKYTKQQSHLSQSQRAHNLDNAFQL
jgi:predicted amidophosphoribosyltransferase